MIKKINYNEFDTFEIYARKNKVDTIKKCYESFGWKLETEQENERYSDTQDLTFSRAHKIKNKDELQLMQVYMEDHLNKLGSLEKNKHSKSVALGLFLGFLSLVIIAVGVYVFLTHTLINIIVGGLCVVIGTSLGIAFAFISYQRFAIENQLFNSKQKELLSELDDICQKARQLLEVK